MYHMTSPNTNPIGAYDITPLTGFFPNYFKVRIKARERLRLSSSSKFFPVFKMARVRLRCLRLGAAGATSWSILES